MSLGLLGGIGAIITGILAYIGYLRSRISTKDLTIASMKNASENKEWDNAILGAIKEVTEKEIDYEKAANDFRSKYNSGDSDGNS